MEIFSETLDRHFGTVYSVQHHDRTVGPVAHDHARMGCAQHRHNADGIFVHRWPNMRVHCAVVTIARYVGHDILGHILHEHGLR